MKYAIISLQEKLKELKIELRIWDKEAILKQIIIEIKSIKRGLKILKKNE